MTERCEDLDQFFDCELGAEAAQEFRDHLATCARCQEVLLGRMLEAAVVDDGRNSRPSFDPLPTDLLSGAAAKAAGGRGDPVAGPDAGPAAAPGGEPVEPLPRDELAQRRRRGWLMIAAAALPAAAVLVLMLRHATRTDGDATTGAPTTPATRFMQARAVQPDIPLAAQRTVDVRFTAPQLDHHRDRLVMRAASAGGDAPSEAISRQLRVELEQRKAYHALLGADALSGDLASARRTAAQLPDTAAALSDRAALELLQAGADAPRATAADDGPAAAQLAVLQRALSLATEALRRQPDLAQAMWNRAIALSRLGLSLAAADQFEDLARRNEDGWSQEAVQRARDLQDEYKRAITNWQQIKDRADGMAAGGPVLDEAAVSRAPSQARDAFYLALATAATPERIDALGPLARMLDARFATTALGDLVAQVRRSDLRIRAPLAAGLRELVEHHPPDKLRALTAQARTRGVRDIALASLQAIPERVLAADDLALFDALLAGSRDDWWRIIALAHRAYFMEFWRRDYPAVDAAARASEPLCKAIRSRWCDHIAMLAGGAYSQMGRADLALDRLTTAQRHARTARLPGDELKALDQLGQAIGTRVADDIDTASVGDAYLDESARRYATCQMRLQRLDFATLWALQAHRYDEAEGHRRDADALELKQCSEIPARINGETARLQLLLRGRSELAAFRRAIARLESEQIEDRRLYRDFFAAAAILVEDPRRGELALREVLAAARANPDRPYAASVRSFAYDVLIDAAARSKDARAVLDLLTERVGAPRFERCALGIASWDHLIVAVLDDHGQPAIETRDVPQGTVMVPGPSAVSQALRDQLAGCPRIDVIAAGPYFGAPGLLDDRVAWVYHAGHAGLGGPAGPAGRTTGSQPGAASMQREVVVSDVAPPDDLHLPALRPFAGGPGAEVLSGSRATPANVLAAMRTASLAVVVAHGVTDAAEPTAASLILSPDTDGDYLLTASKVRGAALAASPVVVLAGCDAGRVQVSAEPWSLATSFLEAGARVVLAPTAPIPDDNANDVFRSLVARIRSGADPASALVAERGARGRSAPWLSSIVIFE